MPDSGTEERDVELPLRLEGRADFHRPTVQGGGLGFYSAIDGSLDMDSATFIREQRAEIERLRAELEKAREALAWYAEQTRLCRLVHSEGDKGRAALAADGGKRALEAICGFDTAGKKED